MSEPPDDPRFVALVAMIGRTGAAEFQIRYSDDEQPVVWVAVAGHRRINNRPSRRGKVNHYEAGGGMTPLQACFRLAEQIVDGSECAHCHRPAGITDDWESEMPLAEHVCWYVYDPEVSTFRRSCEGETTPPRRKP